MTTKPNDILALEPTVRAWADIVIKEWLKKIKSLGIPDGHLTRSLASHVQWAAGGDQQKVKFLFDYVGYFVDWGVGKGVSVETRDALISAGLTTRRQRPWARTTLYKELAILSYKISERMAENAQMAVVQAISESTPPLSI